jgi:hypothetical protein
MTVELLQSEKDGPTTVSKSRTVSSGLALGLPRATLVFLDGAVTDVCDD